MKRTYCRRLCNLTLCFMLLFMTMLGGCQSSTVVSDEKYGKPADVSIRDSNAVQARVFPYLTQSNGIKSPVAVYLDYYDGKHQSGFLTKGDLPLAESYDLAASVIYVSVSPSGSYWTCKAYLTDTNGLYSAEIADFDVTSEDGIAQTLASSFIFSESASDVLPEVAAFQERMLARDYLSLINKCRDDYTPDKLLTASNRPGNINGIVGPIITFGTPTNTEMESGKLYINWGAEEQYAPADNDPDAYKRPNISGKLEIMLGESALWPKAAYTPEYVQSCLKDDSPAFIFEEIIGREFFGSFSDKNGVKTSAYTNILRYSLISADGELLGYYDSYPKKNPDSNTMYFNLSFYTDYAGRNIYAGDVDRTTLYEILTGKQPPE